MSIYIEYDPWCRMGNRMFQYALGYILSTSKQSPLFHHGLLNFNIEPNPGTPANNILETKKFGNNKIDLQVLLNYDGDILINSFLQRSEIYTPYRELLRSAFKINNKSINENKLILHIRETDYLQINCFLGYDFYKNFIKFTSFKDVVIVTDNFKSDTVQRLLSDGCTLATEDLVEKFDINSTDSSMQDFYTLLYSENIALSQSTFSWWAGFLGNHKNVFFPYTIKKLMWDIEPGADDIDLFFDFGYSKKYVE